MENLVNPLLRGEENGLPTFRRWIILFITPWIKIPYRTLALPSVMKNLFNPFLDPGKVGLHLGPEKRIYPFYTVWESPLYRKVGY